VRYTHVLGTEKNGEPEGETKSKHGWVVKGGEKVGQWEGTSKANGAQATQNINKNFHSDILIVFPTPLQLPIPLCVCVFLSRR